VNIIGNPYFKFCNSCTKRIGCCGKKYCSGYEGREIGSWLINQNIAKQRLSQIIGEVRL